MTPRKSASWSTIMDGIGPVTGCGEAQCSAAALYICGVANDKANARELLEACGLVDPRGPRMRTDRDGRTREVKRR